jgi:predicted CXXCH cytochrome family protein
MRWFIFLTLLLLPSAYAGWQGKPLLTLTGMQQPSAVVVSDKSIFVLDGITAKVLVFNRHGKRIATIQAPASSPLKLPMDITLADNKLAVADTGNQRIVLFSLQGDLLQTIKLPAGDKKAQPIALSYQQNTLYWSDRGNHRVCKTTLEDEKTDCWGEYGRKEGQFRYPFMLTSDTEDYLYVVDVLNARIQLFNARGKAFGSISQFGLQAGALFRPNGIAIDGSGNLFVTDNYLGTISTFKQRRFTGRLRDTEGKLIKLNQPTGVFYKDNKLYIVVSKQVLVYQLNEQAIELTIQRNHQALSKASRQDCVMCHIDWNNTFDTPQQKKVISPAAEQTMCLSCHHGAVVDSRLAIMRGKQHPDYHHPLNTKKVNLANKDKSPFDNKLPVMDNNIPYCGSCHTPHAQHKDETGIHPNHHNSWMRQDNQQGQLCKSCHQDYYQTKNLDKKTANHPVTISLQKPPYQGAKGYSKNSKLYKGLPNNLKQHGAKLAKGNTTLCETCHLLHGANDKKLLVIKQEKLCAECHQQQSSSNKKQARKKGIHPVNIKPQNKMTLNHHKVDKVECKSCHDVHGGMDKKLLQTAKTDNAPCEQCHTRQFSIDKKQARTKGVHPIHQILDKAVTLGSSQIKSVECQSCHSVHQGKPMTAALIEKEKPLCMTCHKKQHSKSIQEAHKKGIHPVNFKPDRNIQLKQKKINSVECKTCHSLHNGKPFTAALVQGGKQLCASCHPKQHAKGLIEARKKGIHPIGFKPRRTVQLDHKQIKQMECKTCHSVHNGKPFTAALVQGGKQLCASCHPKQHSRNSKEAHKKGIHPSGFKPNRSIGLNNKKITQMECKTCHSLHNGKPYTAALVQADRQLCRSCHPKQQGGNRQNARKKGVHPTGFKPHRTVQLNNKQIKQMECKTCHSVHSGKPFTASLVKREQQLCSSCHARQNSKNIRDARKKGVHPVGFKLRRTVKIGNKRITQMECKTCHSIHNGKPYTASLIANKQQLCRSCHAGQYAKDKKEARKKGIHPVNIKLNSPLKFNKKIIKKLECQTCHSVHNGKPATPALVTNTANQLCVNCHPRQHATNLVEARKRGVHPVNIKLKKTVSIGRKTIKKLDCISCHSVHHGKPNTPALVQDHKTGQLCKNCHQSESAVRFSDHNLQRTARNSNNLNRETPAQAGVCGSCHSMHKAPRGADRLFIGASIGAMGKSVLKRDRSCFACHRNKGIAKDKVVRLYTHPSRDLVLKSNPQQFPLVDSFGNIKPNGQIACITCHNPHRWMPRGGKHSGIIKGQNEEGNVLNSFLHHKSPQGSFCTNCHGIESQIRFKYYHDQRGRKRHAEYLK